MILSEVKGILPTLTDVAFKIEGGAFVPAHFHITEVGISERRFIDCGGTLRTESKVNFQLWNANDFEHRLKPAKLLSIIELCEVKLGLPNLEVEVEYQGTTIGRYGLDFNGAHFVLKPLATACLAEDACGIPAEKQKVNLKDLANAQCCPPGAGCC